MTKYVVVDIMKMLEETPAATEPIKESQRENIKKWQAHRVLASERKLISKRKSNRKYYRRKRREELLYKSMGIDILR